MTDFEDRLRVALHDLADEVEPAPLLERLEASPSGATPLLRRPMALVSLAAGVVLLLAGTVVALRLDARSSIVEPALTPPKLVRLSESETTRPGAADLAIMVAPGAAEPDNPQVAYLWEGDGTAKRLPASAAVVGTYVQHLSADGTRLVRQNHFYGSPDLELINLETGRVDDLAGTLGYCPALSPDNTTVVMYGFHSGVQFVDARTGAVSRFTAITEKRSCGANSFAWSPDGRRLVVRTDDDSVVLDLRGTVLRRLAGLQPANSSMSWSPEAGSLLAYRQSTGDYELLDMETGQAVVLPLPDEGARPMGWAGSRIVWLAGATGEQRLVSTETDGSDRRPWAELDVGDRVINAVEWSRDLTGTAR